MCVWVAQSCPTLWAPSGLCLHRMLLTFIRSEVREARFVIIIKDKKNEDLMAVWFAPKSYRGWKVQIPLLRFPIQDFSCPHNDEFGQLLDLGLFVHCLWLVKSWLIGKRPWCWEGLGAGEEGDDRGWDGWMPSPTQWTCVWVNSGSWWWTGRPGVLRFIG